MRTWIKPQFSLRSLLIAISLVAVGLGWVRWPYVTACSFVEDPASARSLAMCHADYRASAQALANYQRSEGRSPVIGRERSWLDYLTGRQRFHCGYWEFTVVRGTISNGPLSFTGASLDYYEREAPEE